MKLERILLPTDLSASADRALKQAVELAALTRARLDIFHVVDAGDAGKPEYALEAYLTKVEKEVFDDLATRSEPVRTRGIAVETSVGRGSTPAKAILDRVEETRPDVVVMGTRGRSGIPKLLLGSVAAKVVRGASCPVVTVGSDAAVAEVEAGFDAILVPVDFTEHSMRAVEMAKRFLAPSGKLILQHVVSSPVYPSFYAEGVVSPFRASPDLPNRIQAKLAELFPGPMEHLVSEGSVVGEILETASKRHVPMIAMGTRGLSGFDHVLLGSVAERVIQKARVPVLTVK